MDELTRGKGKLRLVMSKSALRDTEDEIVYWMTKSPEERVAAVEVLRQRL